MCLPVTLTKFERANGELKALRLKRSMFWEWRKVIRKSKELTEKYKMLNAPREVYLKKAYLH